MGPLLELQECAVCINLICITFISVDAHNISNVAKLNVFYINFYISTLWSG